MRYNAYLVKVVNGKLAPVEQGGIPESNLELALDCGLAVEVVAGQCMVKSGMMVPLDADALVEAGIGPMVCGLGRR